MRIHLWIESHNGLSFGLGRAMLLSKVDRFGSLRKAADDMGMSYRAAWGKIRKSEEVLGIKLIVRSSSRKDGCQLTEMGRHLMESYLRWFDQVEREALARASEMLPIPVKGFSDPESDG
ncbi:MAG: LysR family transcriptional regulator [Syntrophobacteraceae bacterium]|nr:LysR family transcriptional regulator [Syntrophobacteraceae bacterium]